MTFDEFVVAHRDEYIRCFPGILGITIKNWLWNDWMVETYPELWHQMCLENRRVSDIQFEERRNFYGR